MVAWQPIAIAEMVEFWSGEQMKCPSRSGAWPPTSIGIAPFSDCAHSDRNEVVCVLHSSIPMPQHVSLEGSIRLLVFTCVRPIRLLLLLGYWRRDRDLLFRTLASGERKSIKANFPFHCRTSDAPTHSLAQQPLPYRTTEDGLHRPHRSLPSPLSWLCRPRFGRETGNPPRWHNFCDDRPSGRSTWLDTRLDSGGLEVSFGHVQCPVGHQRST